MEYRLYPFFFLCFRPSIYPITKYHNFIVNKVHHLLITIIPLMELDLIISSAESFNPREKAIPAMARYTPSPRGG